MNCGVFATVLLEYGAVKTLMIFYYMLNLHPPSPSPSWTLNLDDFVLLQYLNIQTTWIYVNMLAK